MQEPLYLSLDNNNTSTAEVGEVFTSFFNSHYPALCFFAAKLTGHLSAAEDIVSHALLKTWQKRQSLDSTGKLKAYLYQVVRNDCFKHLAKRKRLAGMVQELSHTGATERNILELRIHAELLHQLYNAMQQLPGQCRQVCEMLFKDGKSAREVATELDLNISTVKTQKARAIKALRKVL